MDSAQVYAGELAPLLAPGERLVSATMVQDRAGEERTGRPERGVTFDVVNGLSVPAWEAATERALGGVSLIGGPGSLADQLRRALDDANHLVITDQRILAASLGVREGAVVWQAPRAALAAASHTPRLMQRGRVTLGLADGSVLRVMAGMLSAKEALRLVASTT